MSKLNIRRTEKGKGTKFFCTLAWQIDSNDILVPVYSFGANEFMSNNATSRVFIVTGNIITITLRPHVLLVKTNGFSHCRKFKREQTYKPVKVEAFNERL